MNGIKAKSSFAVIPKFDLALGFPVDWMHCVLLAVSKSLMNFWILSKYHKENFYLGNKGKVLQSQLQQHEKLVSILLFS